MNKYRRIKYEDRCQIYTLSKRGSSQESIAEVLGVSQSVVSLGDAAQSRSARLSVQASGSEVSSRRSAGGLETVLALFSDNKSPKW